MKTLYEFYVRAADSFQPLFLLLIRLYWGWQFAETGWGKLQNIPKVTAFFGTLGIPFPEANAWFVAGLEFAGGLLLIAGLGARLIALPLTINMLVAYVTADREALFAIVADPDKFYAAAPFPFLLAAMIVLSFGAGRFSMDAHWPAIRAARPWRMQAD